MSPIRIAGVLLIALLSAATVIVIVHLSGDIAAQTNPPKIITGSPVSFPVDI